MNQKRKQKRSRYRLLFVFQQCLNRKENPVLNGILAAEENAAEQEKKQE